MNATQRAAVDKMERKRRTRFAQWLANRTPEQEAEAATRRLMAEGRFANGTPIPEPPDFDSEP